MHKLNSGKYYWKSTPAVHLQAVELLSMTLQKQTGNSADMVVTAQEGNSHFLTVRQFCASKKLSSFVFSFIMMQVQATAEGRTWEVHPRTLVAVQKVFCLLVK